MLYLYGGTAVKYRLILPFQCVKMYATLLCTTVTINPQCPYKGRAIVSHDNNMSKIQQYVTSTKASDAEIFNNNFKDAKV